MSGRKCKNCGGSEIEVDTARGDAVCTNCGSVLDNNIIVSEVQFEEGANGSSNAIGQFVSADSKGGATKFGASFHMGASMESREQTLRKARKGITQLCNHLRLNQHCIDTACNFFKRALTENMTRGRRSTHVYAACVYLTCRVEGTAHLLIDISDILQICCYKLGRAYLRITQALSINIPSMDPCIYIMRYAAKLEFGKKMQQVANTASRLVQRMKRDSIHSGRRPSGLCGAAILLAARLHDIGRTPGDIVKIVPIHKTTLRKRMLEFGDTPSSSLTLDEFMTVDLEEEQDPPSFKAARRKDKERLQKLMEEDEDSFTELQKQIELQLEKNMLDRKLRVRRAGSCLRNEDEETDKFIEESTLGTVNKIIKSAVIDEPEEKEVIGLGPDISSMGLVNSLDDISTSVHQSTEELEIDSNFDDLDDSEIDTYILTDTEHKVKKEFWYNRYAEYLEQQKIKQEMIDKEREEGKPEKKRKRSTKKKSTGPANSAGEAIEKIIQEKKLSSKINYDVLRSLNAEPVQTEEVTTIEDEAPASTSEYSKSTKRRKLDLLSDRLDKVSERGKKRMLKDVGLPFFQDVAKEEVGKKEELEKDSEDENKKVELMKDEEQTDAAMLEEDLDDYYDDEEEDQPAEESTNEFDVHALLRQHRGEEDFGDDYDYEEAYY